MPTDRSTGGDRVFDIAADSGGTTPTVALNDLAVRGGDANAGNPTDLYFGGDIRNGGVLGLTRDWITDGFACSGGGVANVGGSLTIEQSLISGNHAACLGGDSGGVVNYGVPACPTCVTPTPDLPGHVVIDDTTIADNDARLVGGVYSWNDPSNTLSITNATLADNVTQDEPGDGAARGPGAGLGLAAGTARVRNSILAGNVEVPGGTTTATNCAPGSGLTSVGDNIDSGADCGLSDVASGQADQSNTNPLLGPLQANGGPTMTLALLSGSPALNRVAAADCPAADQRGIPRPQGTACDIGAFEQQVPPTCVSEQATTAAGHAAVTITLVCTGTAPGPVSYQLVSGPAHGTLSGFTAAGGVITYRPAAGFAGTDTFAYTGTSSGGVGNTATVTVTVPPLLPRLSPSITDRFGEGRGVTRIVSMVVTGVIHGARLQILCRGKGCRFHETTLAPASAKQGCRRGKRCPPARLSATADLTRLFRGWRLGPGATLTVRIVKPGDVGKVYVFTADPPHAPTVRVGCLAPGGTVPGTGC